MSQQTDRNVLAVIPARGGSKEIPRKNLRLLNGKPLIFYTLQNATRSRHITDVVVSSDDRATLDYGEGFGAYLRDRPQELAEDQVTLDPVVHDATEFMEEVRGRGYDVVVTLQPTAPLLRVGTLDGALEAFFDGDADTLIPVVDATHLYWAERDGNIAPAFEERLNRQWLPKTFRESGAFLITKREFVQADSRMGRSVVTFPLNPEEALDIDTQLDWVAAEAAMRRLRIVFVVDGNEKVGLGHLYRTLALADRFVGHYVGFLTFESDDQAVALIKNVGYAVTQTSAKSLPTVLGEMEADILVNDVLDTTRESILHLKRSGVFVVNFEDLGSGANEAHLVFNALYERSKPAANHRFGFEYECLNSKFLLYPPIDFNHEPRTLLLTFGGIDQNNLTCAILEMAPRLLEDTTLETILVVVGPGYAHDARLDEVIETLHGLVVDIHRSVDNMPPLMRRADLAVTSNGRTVYELAAMGVPTISIAQNDRETLHLFSRYHEGVEYLGMAPGVDSDRIRGAIVDLCTDTQRREAMHKAQLRDSAIIRKGTTRTVNEILAEYWKWRDEGDSDR